MPTRFSPPPTAEQVVLAVDAVAVNRQLATVQYVADFSDLIPDQAESALLLAVDLGFVSRRANSQFEVASPLCRFLASMNQLQKATALRVLLESYQPFIVFRQRLVATGVVVDAAKQTKSVLNLAEHHGEISTTLISLGTFSQALFTAGGGQYEVRDSAEENALMLLMEGCSQAAAAEERIRKQIGLDAESIVSRDQVILPLVDALSRAHGHDPRAAVTQAGNAIESYLVELANRLSIGLAGKTGINSKIDEIKRLNTPKMPGKLANVGKYLGHVRNAADHGNDPEIHAPWSIRDATGVEYVFVACSFIAAATALELGKSPEI
ncbi:MAG: hypothetical protein ACRDJW_16080 [Thermomicrobiales bacterium]